MLKKIKVQNADLSQSQILINTRYVRKVEQMFFDGINGKTIAGYLLTYQELKNETRVYKVTSLPESILNVFIDG